MFYTYIVLSSIGVGMFVYAYTVQTNPFRPSICSLSFLYSHSVVRVNWSVLHMWICMYDVFDLPLSFITI